MVCGVWSVVGCSVWCGVVVGGVVVGGGWWVETWWVKTVPTQALFLFFSDAGSERTVHRRSIEAG